MLSVCGWLEQPSSTLRISSWDGGDRSAMAESDVRRGGVWHGVSWAEDRYSFHSGMRRLRSKWILSLLLLRTVLVREKEAKCYSATHYLHLAVCVAESASPEPPRWRCFEALWEDSADRAKCGTWRPPEWLLRFPCWRYVLRGCRGYSRLSWAGVESKVADYVSLCSVSVIIVGLHVLEVWGKRESRSRQGGYI